VCIYGDDMMKPTKYFENMGGGNERG
jgi:hypothetical protein